MEKQDAPVIHRCCLSPRHCTDQRAECSQARARAEAAVKETFTVDQKCIAPNHACPLAPGQCAAGCYLADCEPCREAA